jgi:hypothetical protein
VPLLTYNEFAAANQKGGSNREDLLDFIENLSPSDTPLFNNLGALKVEAGFVEYLEDTLSAAADNAFTEGAAATDQALSVPTRNFSIVQNFQKHYHVSNRQLSVTHAGLANMLGYQAVKKMRELKRDIELALHRGSAVSGDTNVAPQFGGFLNRLSTNFTASSGTTLTEKVFNDIVTLTYANPVNLREVYANMRIKRTINGFTTNTTRFIPSEDRRQVNIVDVYESEIGTLALFKSRDQLQSASPTLQGNSWIAIDPDYFQVGWLRPVQEMELGLDGDRKRRMLVGECTLIVRSEKAGAGGTGFVGNIS